MYVKEVSEGGLYYVHITIAGTQCARQRLLIVPQCPLFPSFQKENALYFRWTHSHSVGDYIPLLLGVATGGNSGQLDTGKYYLCKFRVTFLKTKLSVFALYGGYKDMELNQLPPQVSNIVAPFFLLETFSSFGFYKTSALTPQLWSLLPFGFQNTTIFLRFFSCFLSILFADPSHCPNTEIAQGSISTCSSSLFVITLLVTSSKVIALSDFYMQMILKFISLGLIYPLNSKFIYSTTNLSFSIWI